MIGYDLIDKMNWLSILYDMKIRYVTDREGLVLGVIIPIEEWNNLNMRYEGLQEF